MKTICTAKITVTGGRGGRASSDDGNLAVPLAFPRALGGDGKGTNPEQLFGAGYGACFASTLESLARASGKKLRDVEVEAEVDMLHDGDARFDLAVRLVVRAGETTQAELEALVERAKVSCPYSRATSSAIATSVRAEAR